MTAREVASPLPDLLDGEARALATVKRAAGFVGAARAAIDEASYALGAADDGELLGQLAKVSDVTALLAARLEWLVKRLGEGASL